MNKKRLAGLIIAIVVVFLAGGAIAYWSIGLSIYNRGVAAHNDLDVETAVGQYQVVMRYYPDFLGGFASMAARNQRACLAYQSARRAYDAADYGTACERYGQFLADYPTNRLNRLVLEEHPAAHLGWAKEVDQPGTYLTAIERYQALVDAYPESEQATEARRAVPAVYYNRGDHLRAQAEYQAAVDAYHMAIETDAEGDWQGKAHTAIWETYAQWGSALRAAGEYESAIARYQDAILEGGDETVTRAMWKAIGETYLEQARAIQEDGDYEAAISLCESAVARFPESGWHDQVHAFVQAAYLKWAAALHADQKYEAAISVYQARLRAYPDVERQKIDGKIITTYYTWAREEWEAQRYQDALAVYEELIEMYPDDALAQQARGKLPQLHYDWAADASQEKAYETAVQHYQAGMALEEQAVPEIDVMPSAPQAYVVTVNTNSLNVRKAPGAEEEVVGVVKRGDSLHVVGRDTEGSWLQIERPAGWVFASLVSSDTPIQDIPLQVEATVGKPAIVEASPSAARAWEATAEVLYEWGMSLCQEASYEEATEKFQTVIEGYALSQVITQTRTACGTTYLTWGDALSSTQEYEAAAEAYEGVLRVDPEGESAALAVDGAAGAYLAWASSLQEEKAYHSAILKYEVVYTDYPDSSHVGAAYAGVVSCYSAWGDQLCKEGKYSDAIQKYQAIADSFPQSQAASDARVAMGQTYNLWGAALHNQAKYSDAMTKFAQAWQATSNADVVAAAQKGYNDALWAVARLTDATGRKIINDALGTACQGQAAASPAVGLATGEAGKALCDSSLFTLPGELKAAMPAHFRYAICVTNGAKQVKRCSYTGGHTLVRQQLWWQVTVRDPKTGRWIAENTFYGAMPGSCPFSYVFYSKVAYKSGGNPSSQDVINWLRGIVK